jgi:hypothetical protein
MSTQALSNPKEDHPFTVTSQIIDIMASAVTFATGSNSLPLPMEDETERCRDWLNEFFEKRCVQQLLPLATAARTYGHHHSRFGHRLVEGHYVNLSF